MEPTLIDWQGAKWFAQRLGADEIGVWPEKYAGTLVADQSLGLMLVVSKSDAKRWPSLDLALRH